jgi:hypothetical protein
MLYNVIINLNKQLEYGKYNRLRQFRETYTITVLC